MTPSRNGTGNRATGTRRRFPGLQRPAALLLATSVFITACDRAIPPATPAPQAEPAATPNPDTASPPPVAPASSNSSGRPASVVSDPRLLPWMDEYANTEAEEDRSGPIYRIAEQVALGVPADEVVAALVDVFSREKSAKLKSEILGHLTKVHHPSALPAITRGLAADQPADVRLATVRTLQYLADRKALPTLRRALSDPDPKVRDAAKDTLATLAENP